MSTRKALLLFLPARLILVLLLSCPTICWGCDCRHADFVTHLPGWDQPLPSPWHSGYLTYTLPDNDSNKDVSSSGGTLVHTHYVLVQAEQDYHHTKPLIYWSNGGPGASSMFGLLTEVGPLLLSDLSLQTNEYRSSGIPSLLYNPYTWTRMGSILIIDQPAPVGFSYCNNDTNNLDPNQCGAWTDERSAENAYMALQAFYNKFPCYQNTSLYLTGESYAGIYIPTLARRILNDALVDDQTSRSNDNVSNLRKDKEETQQQTTTNLASLLKGFAVGDGCLGTETGVCGDLSPNQHRADLFHILFLAGHGQIPFATFTEVVMSCQSSQHSFVEASGQDNKAVWDTGDDKCQQALAKASEEAGGYFEYALYDDCIYRNLGSGKSSRKRRGVGGAVNDYPCGGYPVMEDYLKFLQVKHALHVKGTFFSVDNAENFNYTPTERDLTSFYRDVATHTNVRVLVYNGDTDPSITSFVTQNWTSHLGLTELQSWRPWSIDSCQRVGGYVTRYHGDLDFLTVRGAGHMVPTYKAEATFAFLKSWIENTDYPKYDNTCTKPVPASQWDDGLLTSLEDATSRLQSGVATN